MNNSKSVLLSAFLTLFIITVSLSCSTTTGSSPTKSPVTIGSTFVAPYTEILGKWQLSGDGTWNDSILYFGSGGELTITDPQGTAEKGSWSFINKNTIMFKFTDSPGAIIVAFKDTDHIALTVRRSPEPEIYTAERVSK